MDERERGFHRIKEYFDKVDMEQITKRGISVWQTEYGLFGSSDLYDVFELFKQINLEKSKKFIDLGSGDGRVVLIASLFTNAVGMEGDKELHEIAVKAQKALETNATFKRGDYTKHNLKEYDIIFIYADHNWPESFQKKLSDESDGTLFSLHNIYKPNKLKKGKTYWIGQVPFVSYDLSSSE